MTIATHSTMYKDFAEYYDAFYQSKNYEKECVFLETLFSKYDVKTLLDVGCGTGTHLRLLEQKGYCCEGIDFNETMLHIARKKVICNLTQTDMRYFDLHQSYDAITSLFAVFNHNLTIEDAKKTLCTLKAHLNTQGILILDLYNPQSSGKKSNSIGDLTKVMEWEIHPFDALCQSNVSFFIKTQKVYEETFPLKIYSIPQIYDLLTYAGFNQIKIYNNFEFEPATSSSKNLVVVAKQ